MKHTFQRGRRYRLTILPSGARTRTLTFDANYLGLDPWEPETTHSFDARPESGTQSIRDESIRGVEELGAAVDGRR